jgi:hypothetical protein
MSLSSYDKFMLREKPEELLVHSWRGQQLERFLFHEIRKYCQLITAVIS